MSELENTGPPSPARLSKTPSWVMLGFLVGAVVVGSWRLDTQKKEASAPPPEPPPVRLERPQPTEIEAVFAEWGRYAIWKNDLTEVALWDRDKRDFSQFYEVLRSGDACYFRTIPKLTRPIMNHGVKVQSPLMFTETEESRREWEGRDRSTGLPPGANEGPLGFPDGTPFPSNTTDRASDPSK